MLRNVFPIPSRSFQTGVEITHPMNKTYRQKFHTAATHVCADLSPLCSQILCFQTRSFSIISVYFHSTPTLIATATERALSFAAYNSEQRAMDFRASICCQPQPAWVELQRATNHYNNNRLWEFPINFSPNPPPNMQKILSIPRLAIPTEQANLKQWKINMHD